MPTVTYARVPVELKPEELQQLQDCLQRRSSPILSIASMLGSYGGAYGVCISLGYAKRANLCGIISAITTAFIIRVRKMVACRNEFIRDNPDSALARQLGIVGEYNQSAFMPKTFTSSVVTSDPNVTSDDINSENEKYLVSDAELAHVQISGTKYEDLRKRNRDEFYDRPRAPQIELQVEQTEEFSTMPEQKGSTKSTKYGDVWE